jgi:hypothetical protein
MIGFHQYRLAQYNLYLFIQKRKNGSQFPIPLPFINLYSQIYKSIYIYITVAVLRNQNRSISQFRFHFSSPQRLLLSTGKDEETPQSFHLHLRQIQTHSSQAHPNSVPNFTVTLCEYLDELIALA